MDYDVILCSVPKSNSEAPFLGLSILCSVLKQNNYSVKILDFNIELYNLCFEIIDDFSESDWVDFEYYFRDGKNFKHIKKHLTILIDSWIDEISSYKPKFVGFCIFTQSNGQMVYYMCEKMRQKLPKTKLIVGGPYTIFLGEEMYNNNLVDYYVNGYGEKAILAIVENKTTNFPGINGIEFQPVDLAFQPFPDYSDLDLTKYSCNHVYISTSRGCIYRCKFCAVTSLWHGFNFRPTENIVNEMIDVYQKYNITEFHLTDSTFNASMKHYRNLCAALIEEKIKFEWMTFISVPKESKMSDQDFNLLGEAGCYLVKIGVESGSPRIRKHMGKDSIDNEDLFRLLNQLRRVGVNCEIFLMAGYPTETDDDHNLTKKLVYELQEYKDIIKHVRVSPTTISFGTPLYNDIEALGITLGKHGNAWSNNLVSVECRTNRYIELRECVDECEFNIKQTDKQRLTSIFTGKSRKWEDEKWAKIGTVGQVNKDK